MSTTKKTIKKVSGKAKIGGPGAAKREAAPQHWCWLTYKYYLRESRKVRPHRWWGASRAEPSAPPPCPSPPPPAPGQETPPVGCSDLALFKGIFGNLQIYIEQEFKSKKNRHLSPRAARFSYTKNHRDLKNEYFLKMCKYLPVTARNNRQKEYLYNFFSSCHQNRHNCFGWKTIIFSLNFCVQIK